MHVYGHTQASQIAGFATTIPERQTFLKMLVADYCGTGKVFTVAGQPLMWTDDRGTMPLTSGVPRTTEARWQPSGADCVNEPRVDEYPTEDGMAEFPDGAEAAIAAECTRPPRCPLIMSTSYHIRSYNITSD